MLLAGIFSLLFLALPAWQIAHLLRRPASRLHRILGISLSLAVAAIAIFMGISLIAISMRAKSYNSVIEHLSEGHALVKKIRDYGQKIGAFPAVKTSWVPPIPYCRRDGSAKRISKATDWQCPPWNVLGWSRAGMNDPLQYRYVSDGKRATVEFRVDASCRDRYSRQSYELEVDPRTRVVTSRGLDGENEFGK
jgi:hypothetical protein